MALFGAKQNKTKQAVTTDEKTEAKDVKIVKKEVKAEKEAKEIVKDGTEVSMKDLYANENTTKKSAQSKKTDNTSRYDGAFRVLVKPLITEKATDLSASNKYVFVITQAANKIEVAKAVQVVYGVKPVSINIISMKGKVVTRGRTRGRRKDWKKAIVTLKKGESIKIYEGV